MVNDNVTTAPFLTTKLYIPPIRPEVVVRPRLVDRLNESLRLGHKLILVSAPAGYGKTTLGFAPQASCGQPLTL